MQGDTSRLWVKMDIEMQIIKAYVKENNYVSQKLCWYCEKICYMMQLREIGTMITCLFHFSWSVLQNFLLWHIAEETPFNISCHKNYFKSSLYIFRKVCYGAWTFIVIPLWIGRFAHQLPCTDMTILFFKNLNCLYYNFFVICINIDF